MTADLLPCPFCEGEAHIDGTSWTTRDGKDQSWVTCRKCGTYGPSSTDQVGAWNRRALPAPEPRDVRAQCPYGAKADDCCGGYCSMNDETEKGGDAHDRRIRSHEASPGVTAGAEPRDVRAAALKEAADIAMRHLSKVQINEPLWHDGQDWAAQRIADAILALIGEPRT